MRIPSGTRVMATTIVAFAVATTALAQDRGGSHSGGGRPGLGSPGGQPGWRDGGRSPGWNGNRHSPGWRGDRSPGWHGGSRYFPEPHRGGLHPSRPFGYRHGAYPRYGYPYGYFVPPVVGYYGPAYYEPYPAYVTPYYEYVEPPTIIYQAPQIAQVVPAPLPRPEPLAPRPEPPAPQPTPAPKTFERMTLAASELFAFDRAELSLPQPKLDQIAAALVANPQINHVRIIGYTDRLGSESYNLRLSQRRADAVKAYLVSKGIAAGRLNAIGKGEADPIVFCTQVNRAQLIECLRANRRVVVEPITIEQPR